MKERAKQMQLPPMYTGKWRTASDEEIKQELAKGTSYTYRFRVPKEGNLKITDLIRGEVRYLFILLSRKYNVGLIMCIPRFFFSYFETPGFINLILIHALLIHYIVS